MFQLLAMPSHSRYMSSRVMKLLGIIIAAATVVTTAQGAQPEDCRLYQVTAVHPSPTFEISGNYDETYISLGLLFNSSMATINIFNGDSDMPNDNVTTSPDITDKDSTNSCQMTVSKVNGNLEGSCFHASKEIPLKCSQDEGMDTIVLRRRGPLIIAFIVGDDSDTKVLTTKAPNTVKFNVTSNTFVNTVFNCPSSCYQFNNAFIHSIYELSLYAKQIATGEDGNVPSVITVFHGQDLRENRTFDFNYFQDRVQEDNESMVFDIDYPRKGIQENDGGLGTQFKVISQYDPKNDSTYSLSVSGSLFGSENPSFVGVVPSLDTIFKFENMETILWTTCPIDHTSESPTTEVATTSSSVGIMKSVTGVITPDDQITQDYESETDVEVTITGIDEPSTSLPLAQTTIRFIEEISCRDTWDPKCTLTKDQGGSCNCAEAKSNGWCDDLENHPDVKENCKKTCSLCPDQDGVSERIYDIEGREDLGESDDSLVATKPPNAGTASGNIFVYVMIGIVVVMLLVLVIWLTCKKRRASGKMDLEGQSQTMPLKESDEKTNENNSDAEKINKQEKEDKNEGTKNNAYQEQDEVKEKLLNDEKADAEEGNKADGENSPIKAESEYNNPDNKSPKDNEKDAKKEKDMGDKDDDKEDTADNSAHGDDVIDIPNGDTEKNQKSENENENASKGITDSLENEKSIE